MGYMLRSDFMSLYDLYIQPEAAFKIITHLGNGGYVQFLDMNQNVQAFHRCYVSEICRCSEIERILRFLEDEMKKEGIPIMKLKYDPKPLQPNEMIPLETLLEKWDCEITELNSNYAGLLKLYTEMSEMHYVLDSVGPMLGDAEIRNALLPKQFMTEADILSDLSVLPGHLMIVTGVVKRIRSFPFQMMLWRISHGNIYYRQTQDDQLFKDCTGLEERKVAFLVICQGDQLHQRVLKVCSGFRAILYPCPRTSADRLKISADIAQKLTDQHEVLKKTKYQRCKALFTVSQQWKLWRIRVKKTKAIYHTMNLFNVDITRKCLIGRCWIPNVDVPKVQGCLKSVSDKIGTNVESFMIKSDANEKPPTYHRTNKFTHGFQALINAYGESTYREVNPGLFTIITFPFLFAVMFGDLGHGIILIVFALWMILKEKKIIALRSTNEIFNIAFGGRYVILMLGIFSVITGFLYNDTFSRAFRLTDSFWKNHYTKDDITNNTFLTIDPNKTSGLSYVYGLDPIWKVAANRIVFENSFKMKMSIILGVVHMLFGLSLAFVNSIYFKKYYHIWLVDLPAVIILSCLFLWLVILMYVKWIIFNPYTADINTSPGCATLLLLLLIDLILAGQSDVKMNPGCRFYLFEYQDIIHRVLLLLVLICIPIMLFAAPLYLKRKANRVNVKEPENSSKFRKYRKSQIEKLEAEQALKPQKEDFKFGDTMIRQAIHTIEYTLSTVSHTASYLRLWALSLAHAQLSEMLWGMILRDLGLRACLKHNKFTGVIFLFVIFSVWAGFTISILIVMEGMSAFLHTLRLHWVEFMSKFYMGDGWMFTPFSFANIYSEVDDKIDAVCKKRG